MPPRLLTVDDAAEYLGITSRALRARQGRRQIPFLRVGGRIYFRRAQLDQWVESAQECDIDEAVEGMRRSSG